MAVNNLTVEQSYAFLTDLYKEATGQSSTIKIEDTGTFVTVGQMVLKTGYDNVISSISKVLGKTIFNVRPYSARFKGLEVDSQKWGAITRMIDFIDTPLESDDRLALTDGQSVDPWVIRNPKVLETNYYGTTQYQKHITIYKDQLDDAFRSESEFGSFLAGLMQNVADQLEQFKEAESRACLINFITGKLKGDANNCINVLQKYYDETGVVLTPQTMYKNENYVEFTKWLYSFINTLTDFMAERSTKYHINVTGKEVMRHTPPSDVKAYMYSGVLNKIDSTVLSSIFNPEKLKMIDFESVAFWQNIDHPTQIKAKPTYLKSDGTLATETTAVNNDGIIGVIFDRDAMGITVGSTWTQSTPLNARGGYSNVFYHMTTRMWNNFTMNGVVLYVGTVTQST